MESIALKASLREITGKKSSKQARKDKLVPCILYGGKENLSLQVCEADFRDIIYTPTVYAIQLDVEGKAYQVILKDLQFDPVSDKLTHVDFLEVSPDKVVTVELPIKIEGTSIGVREGGKMVLEVRKLKVKGLIGDIPGEVVVNISKLVVGKSIKVGNLIPKGYQIVASADMPIVSVRATRAVAGAETVTEEGK